MYSTKRKYMDVIREYMKESEVIIEDAEDDIKWGWFILCDNL